MIPHIVVSSDQINSPYGDPDSKVHGANMGPTWVLSAPDWPHIGPMNHAFRGATHFSLFCVAMSSIVMTEATSSDQCIVMRRDPTDKCRSIFEMAYN